ncbi:MAG: aldehyde dehydrogenase family protein [Bacteroidia bacterium]|nr:aldehyde dehydrogenase family protein [Bacteroidia bacterium]
MDHFYTISPIDSNVYVERSYASSAEIEKTLAIGQTAQKQWKHTTIDERAQICRIVVDYFVKHAEAIGEELTYQMGRPICYTPSELTKGFRERAEYMIAIAGRALENVEAPNLTGFERYVQRDPLGTVLVLAPWNYPYLTSVNAIIPAIMAGNTVILKHAQQTPLCAERYQEAFDQAGLPKGVFQYLHLNHGQVADIIKDHRIDFVAFTGSVTGGKAIQQAMASRFINAGLELGGKDPAYVKSDADLAFSIENLVDGAFFNSGQSCCGIERIYVHKKIFKDFVDGFVDLTKQYKLGNPLNKDTTLGPMVKISSAKFAQQQIEQAIAKGATNLIDPFTFSSHDPESPYMAPQVLIDVDHSMDIMTEETFAPVVGIMPVDSDEEAIQLMNDSRYGLTASVWTADLDRAKVIGNQIDTGTFFMNRCDYLDPALAWTGVKNSGRGVTLSPLGYEVLTRPKSYHLKLGN